MCPYYQGDQTGKCNLTDTYPDNYTIDEKCKNSSNWRNCANYTNPAYDDESRARRRLR